MSEESKVKAVVLFSGGLDSTVALAIALEQGRECYALSFDYQQRHRCELEAAKELAAHYEVPHQIFTIDPQALAGSALTTGPFSVSKGRSREEISGSGIPTTYVPARNALFLSYALGQAELLGAQEIYIGANKLDHTGYPDCRPAFLKAYQAMMNTATKQALEGNPPRLVYPLIEMDKAQIIAEGMRLGVTIDRTWSCYSPDQGKPCGSCDACVLRQEGIITMRKI